MDEQVTQVNMSDSSEMDGKYLTFWIDGQIMGVSIADVVQIIGIQPITVIPEFPVYCKGIINLRGSIIPLIDIHLRFGKPEVEYTDRTCIIVLNIYERYFGFIVDEVDEVAAIPEERIAPPVQIGSGFTNEFISGIARLEDGSNKENTIILCIDAKKVLGENEFHALADAGMFEEATK